MSDLMRQKTLRMDAKYWIQKALLKKRKKELEKKKAWAGISDDLLICKRIFDLQGSGVKRVDD